MRGAGGVAYLFGGLDGPSAGAATTAVVLSGGGGVGSIRVPRAVATATRAVPRAVWRRIPFLASWATVTGVTFNDAWIVAKL